MKNLRLQQFKLIVSKTIIFKGDTMQRSFARTLFLLSFLFSIKIYGADAPRPAHPRPADLDPVSPMVHKMSGGVAFHAPASLVAGLPGVAEDSSTRSLLD